MATNYKIIPAGRLNSPPLEADAGAYYYKYSYSWTSKSASTEVELSDAQLKFDGSLKNHGYIFLSCMGTKTTPPEFGLFAPYNEKGTWYPYSRQANSTAIDWDKNVKIFVPSGTMGGAYTYKTTGQIDNSKIVMRITLLGTQIIGQILRNGKVIYNKIISGNAAGIGETASANTFLVGTSLPPVPGTEYPGNRNAYLKHVYLHNGMLYPKTNYSGTAVEWEPDPANSVTYYALLCRPEYVTYNRFGTRDEEISIDYS